MGKYDIDFAELQRQNMPVEHRNPKHTAWLKSLCAPGVWLYGLFLEARDAFLYEIGHNGQVCRLRKMLNDKFDSTERRIYIADSEPVSPVYLFRDAELKPVYIYTEGEDSPVYLRRDEELNAGGSFIVFVPEDLVYDEIRMRNRIDNFKLAGKGYTIQTF
jgi:hypothetical protein